MSVDFLYIILGVVSSVAEEICGDAKGTENMNMNYMNDYMYRIQFEIIARHLFIDAPI